MDLFVARLFLPLFFCALLCTRKRTIWSKWLDGGLTAIIFTFAFLKRNRGGGMPSKLKAVY